MLGFLQKKLLNQLETKFIGHSWKFFFGYLKTETVSWKRDRRKKSFDWCFPVIFKYKILTSKNGKLYKVLKMPEKLQ